MCFRDPLFPRFCGRSKHTWDPLYPETSAFSNFVIYSQIELIFSTHVICAIRNLRAKFQLAGTWDPLSSLVCGVPLYPRTSVCVCVCVCVTLQTRIRSLTEKNGLNAMRSNLYRRWAKFARGLLKMIPTRLDSELLIPMRYDYFKTVPSHWDYKKMNRTRWIQKTIDPKAFNLM